MHAVSNEGNIFPSSFVSVWLNRVFIVFSIPLFPSSSTLWSRKNTHMLSLEALVVIVSCFCVCFFRQFYALDSPPGINPKKSNQTLFISTDSHFRFISSDRGQILYQLYCSASSAIPSSDPSLAEAASQRETVLPVMKHYSDILTENFINHQPVCFSHDTKLAHS